MKTRNVIHWMWMGLIICLLDAAPAHAFYNPQQGRWINRDPLTDESPLLESANEDDTGNVSHLEPEGAPTLFVNNDPGISYDSLGLWPSSSPFIGFLLGGIPMTHQNSIHRAIPDLLPGDEQQLDAATVFVDTFQRPSDAYMHAMRNGASHESAAHARQSANDFVKGHILNAQKLLCSCNPDRAQALLEFGQALHTVQDSTSPAHQGFQPWHGLGLNPINYFRALRHITRENFDPGPGSSLDGVTSWLWTFFKCKDNAPPLPDDFF